VCRLRIALRAFLEQLTATGHHVEATGPLVGTGPHASKHSSLRAFWGASGSKQNDCISLEWNYLRRISNTAERLPAVAC